MADQLERFYTIVYLDYFGNLEQITQTQFDLRQLLQDGYDIISICGRINGSVKQMHITTVCQKMIWPSIAADMQLDELTHIHKRIWNYVLRWGGKPDTPYISNCALCTYAFKRRALNDDFHSLACDYCPSNICCFSVGSPYTDWRLTKNTTLAREIRDIHIFKKETE